MAEEIVLGTDRKVRVFEQAGDAAVFGHRGFLQQIGRSRNPIGGDRAPTPRSTGAQARLAKYFL
jgi:hypothetical protein